MIFLLYKNLGIFYHIGTQNEWSQVVRYEVPKCPGHPIDDFSDEIPPYTLICPCTVIRFHEFFQPICLLRPVRLLST